MSAHFGGKMLFLLKIFVPCCISLFSIISYAEPQQYVWRLDARIPDNIFQEGFQPWGNNDDLIAHVTGTTIEGHTTAFVATTGVARPDRLAGAMLRLRPGLNNRIWLYRIRANNNFYDTIQTLRTVPATNNNFDTVNDLIIRYEFQNEFVALAGIAGNQVIDAVPVEMDRDGRIIFHDDRAVTNRHYTAPINPNVTTNPAPYRIYNNNRIRRLWTAARMAIGRGFPAGFGLFCTKSSSTTNKSDEDSCILVLDSLINVS